MPTGDFPDIIYGNCLGCYGSRCTSCWRGYNSCNRIQPSKTRVIEKFDDKGNLIERITETI